VWAGGITTHPHVGAAGFTTYLRSLMHDKWRSQIYTGAPAANEKGYNVYRGGFSRGGGGGIEDTGESIDKEQDTGIPSPPPAKEGK
jgi:hypothetical protein